MAQQIINTGAAANDGTGDPLRTAFTETNNNFTEIYTAGPVNSNVRIVNNTILTLNTNGNLVLAPNGTGQVVANVDVVPNRANVRNLGSNSARWSTVYTQYLNVTNGTTVAGDLTVGGNLTVTGNTVQIGNLVTDAKTLQLANTANTANAAAGSGITVGASDNIATLLYNSTGNVWTTNIGLSAVGNVTAPYFIGNGSQLTGLPVPYGNANVVTLLAGFGSNTITTTGNITAGNFIGNGSTLTSVAGANVTGTVANATYATSSESATTAGTVTTAAQGNITSVGVLTSLSATGNVTGGNLITGAEVVASGVIQTGTGFSTGGYLSVNGSADLHDTNIIGNLSVNVIRSDDSTVVLIQDGVEIDGDAVVNGNVTADYFIGDGSQLTGISSTGNLAVIGTTIVIDSDAPETSIAISPSGESYAYLALPNNATANTDNTRLWNAAGNLEIGTGDVSNAESTYTWLFGNDGNLSLPRGGIVYETNIPGGVFAGNTIALKPFGGIDADQQLLIYPTGNIFTDINHLHLTSGNLYNTELFLGNDDLYVKLANTGNVVINSNDGVGNAAQWTFDTTGNATFPANGTTNLHDVVSVGLATFSNVQIGGNLNYAESANLIVVEDKDGFADIIAQNLNAGGNASMNIVLVNNDPGNVYMAVGVNSSTFTPLYNTLFEIPDAGYVSHSTTQVMGPQSAESGESRMFFTYSSGSYALELNDHGAIGWGASYNGNLTQGNFGNAGQVLTSAGENSAPTWSNIPAPTVAQDITSTGDMSIMTYDGNLKYVNYATVEPSTGNIKTSGNISATGNIIAANLGNIVAINLDGNVGNVLSGNGTWIAAGSGSTYGNANVATFLAAFGSNTISTSGNVTAGNLIGNISITGNVQGTTANVTLVAGVYSTVFDNTGNLTLPGNTFAVNYANGTAVALGGGSGTVTNVLGNGTVSGLSLTGNVTTTGNLTLGGTLDLSSLSGNISTTGNITANNLGNISTINLTGSSSNVLYGNGTFAPAAGGGANTGNVTFDDVNIIGTGNLNLQPNGSASEYLNIYLTGSADIHVAAGGGGGNVILGTDEQANVAVLSDGNVAIQAGNVGGTKTWTFDTAGNLALPMNSVVYETNIPDGALSGSAIALKPTGGTTANQQLLIYPTANDGDHIHLTSGNLYTTELFLGSDNLYVKLANTGNVVINSNDGNSSNAQWTFGTDGNLTLPTLSLGTGLDEQTVVQSQRKIIPPFRWSAVIDGATPTVVYTAANPQTTSMKVTVQVQHQGFSMEFFDVSATKAGADTYYTVSNRVAPPTIAASTVVVDLNGSTMQITVTVNSGAATSWVTYDAVEFGIPND